MRDPVQLPSGAPPRVWGVAGCTRRRRLAGLGWLGWLGGWAAGPARLEGVGGRAALGE